MKIVLLNRYRFVNGTQTMIVRMARSLREQGHEPIFIRFNRKPVALLEQIERYARVAMIEDLLSRDWARRIGPVDAIYCYTEDTLIRMLRARHLPTRKIAFGLYHTRQFCAQVRWWDSYLNKLYRSIFRRFPRRNIVFMNEPVRQACETNFNMSMAGSEIVPIPVDVNPSYRGRVDVPRWRIVSVGRLVEFKNYHRPVIEFVAARKAAGLPGEYHIYGDGPTRPDVERLVDECNVADRVRIWGTLPYAQLGRVLEGAGLFIGMGTALVEACGCGVPSIGAVDMQETRCYGWFHDTSGYAVGELIDEASLVPIAAKLDEGMIWSDEEYRAICQKSWQRAREFSADAVVKQFVNVLEAAMIIRDVRVTEWQWFRFWAAKAYARYFTKPGWRHK